MGSARSVHPRSLRSQGLPLTRDFAGLYIKELNALNVPSALIKVLESDPRNQIQHEGSQQVTKLAPFLFLPWRIHRLTRYSAEAARGLIR